MTVTVMEHLVSMVYVVHLSVLETLTAHQDNYVITACVSKDSAVVGMVIAVNSRSVRIRLVCQVSALTILIAVCDKSALRVAVRDLSAVKIVIVVQEAFVTKVDA